MDNYNINILSDQGFPFCPACGGVLYWDDDRTKSERGMVAEDDPHAGETVNMLHCADCEREYDLFYTDEGPELIDVSTY